MELSLQNDLEKQKSEPSSEPTLMSKYVPCEWKYDWLDIKSSICGKPLTNKEIEHCKKNKEILGGRMLCFGHQDQYIKKFN